MQIHDNNPQYFKSISQNFNQLNFRNLLNYYLLKWKLQYRVNRIKRRQGVFSSY